MKNYFGGMTPYDANIELSEEYGTDFDRDNPFELRKEYRKTLKSTDGKVKVKKQEMSSRQKADFYSCLNTGSTADLINEKTRNQEEN